MILMPQILDVTANENARYKRNELEFRFILCPKKIYQFRVDYRYGLKFYRRTLAW